MNIKVFFLLSFYLIANKSFAQRRDELICASDTARTKLESALYILRPLATGADGLKAPRSDNYYCIEKDHKMTFDNVDSVNVGFDKYSRLFILNFYFNKTGTEQLAIFSTKYLGKDVGLFINNKLISAARIVSSIDGGNMTLQGNFTESEVIILRKEIEAIAHK
jgi:preprotein translocase subunit SecD